MAKWKNNHNPDSFVKQMEKTRSIKDNGEIQFSGTNILIVPAHLENIIELNSLVTEEDKHTIVWSAILSAGKKGPLSSDSIIEEIKKLEKEYLSTREQKYILVSTLSINSQKHKLPNLKIDGNRIRFSSKKIKNFIKYISENQNIESYLRKSKIPNDYTWVSITVLAKGIHDATQKALKSLNIFRGMLNYLINYGNRSFYSDNKPKPINKIRYGPIHTLHKPNGKLVDDIFWYEEECFELAKSYHNNIEGDFDKMINSFCNFCKQLNKSKIKDVLENAILLYNSALDSYSFDTAFIKLWATLELLTATGRENYDVTVKRTAFIFKNVEEIKAHLNILRDIRNNIVHKGYMEGEKDIFLYDLKLYVEQLIRFLLKNVKGLNNFGEIKQLLDSSPDINDLIRNRKELIGKFKINKRAQKLRHIN